MSSIALPTRIGIRVSGERALNFATRSWFIVMMIGQLVFGFAVASFYGMTAARGDYYRWTAAGGRFAGDPIGNAAIAMHFISAAIIMLSGALQLIPRMRSRFPRFHRWNGRLYMLTALTLSAGGVYMTWFRNSVGDTAQHIASTLNAVLIWVCLGFALYYAIKRDFATHRRWALRFFLVVSASFFLRLFFFPIVAIFGPVGFDPLTFSGPMLTFMTYAEYLVPLAVVELYFRAQRDSGAFRRLLVAGLLFAFTLVMTVGVVVVSMAIWVPQVKAAFDTRTSIARTIWETLDARGIDEAVAQYHALKSVKNTNYNFDKAELNRLGYQLMRRKRLAEATRIFQLNVESYPDWSNGYDSLGEAYANAGNTPLAIANYRKAVQLDPKNGNAAAVLRKLQNVSPRASSSMAR